jgi:hypothetical protein
METEIVITPNTPYYGGHTYFMTFRCGNPTLTVSTACKDILERWNKRYMKIVIKPAGRIIEFVFSDIPDGFRVFHQQPWIKGVFKYGINSARLRDELFSLGIEYQRLQLKIDEKNQKFVYEY